MARFPLLRAALLSAFLLAHLQAAVGKPTLAFVKLHPEEDERTYADVEKIVEAWRKDMASRSVKANAYASDSNTVHIAILHDKELDNVKDFILSRPEAYEMMVGEEIFRRPDDKPLKKVLGYDPWTRERQRFRMMAEREKVHLEIKDRHEEIRERHREKWGKSGAGREWAKEGMMEEIEAEHMAGDMERIERRHKMREEWLRRHAKDDL